MRRRPTIPAPAVAPSVVRLAELVPEKCPDDACRSIRIAVVAGGEDRRPIVEVTFSCGRIVSVPETAR